MNGISADVSPSRQAMVIPGTLYVVGTPIGNLEDISFRAVRVLSQVDVIAAEDTRKAAILLNHYGIRKPKISFFKGNEKQRESAVLDMLTRRRSVALISEAGMPGISDPGAALIRECIACAIPVDIIPGPSAVLTALLLSGLDCGVFSFGGFFPRRSQAQRQFIERCLASAETWILFEAPRRVGVTLALLAKSMGERPAVVARELTKLHQEVVRGSLRELAAIYAQAPPRGEVTIVIQGGGAFPALQKESIASQADVLEAEIRDRLQSGERPKHIADALHQHGRRRMYQLALTLLRDMSTTLSSEGLDHD